ncbi:hypothetical protein HPB52_012954 [Rhipicephalus sanguineus]|uniref:Uncharacterized protein n=1 Tax=Rhipicephalus sanguineus TaxID=34632 RepID=A0A9D4SYX2_RHISA|nr:hypothetical protein HPB52_012954 [Rhipicephalus sanguineus]
MSSQFFLLMWPSSYPMSSSPAPSDATPCQHLKTKVLQRCMPSERARLQQVHAERDLGDRRHSELLAPNATASRRANVGFRDVPLVLKGTTPCRQNRRVVGSSSSTVAQSHRSSPRRPCGS